MFFLLEWDVHRIGPVACLGPRIRRLGKLVTYSRGAISKHGNGPIVHIFVLGMAFGYLGFVGGA